MFKPTPARLWFVRHGESQTNVARRLAKASGALTFDTGGLRDADVPLTPHGVEQGNALAEWFNTMHDTDRPNILVASPFVRAKQTAMRCVYGDGHGDRALYPKMYLKEERLREIGAGSLWGLTGKGIEEKYPEESARYHREGVFYYRPPGGESWADVIERVRQALRDLCQDFPGERVLVVTHEKVILAAQYVLLGWDEQEMLEADRTTAPNCSVTSFTYDHARNLWVPDLIHFVPPSVGDLVTLPA